LERFPEARSHSWKYKRKAATSHKCANERGVVDKEILSGIRRSPKRDDSMWQKKNKNALKLSG
jgi:hypothetical protein